MVALGERERERGENIKGGGLFSKHVLSNLTAYSLSFCLLLFSKRFF